MPNAVSIPGKACVVVLDQRVKDIHMYRTEEKLKSNKQGKQLLRVI